MKTHNLRLAVAFTAVFVPEAVVAHQDVDQAGAAQLSTEMAQCARVQPVVDRIISAAMVRLESARLSNNPADMRAAVDHLQAGLRDVRAQLAPCAAAAGDSHTGHTMPSAPSASESVPAPKAAPGKPERPQPADVHTGHGSGQQSGKQMDPVNGLMVDPATSPRTTYEGQTYYFSSEQTRKEFLQSPAKFARKHKQ
jgi:YHS domain-containing protein